jgi:hypothetical protein
MYTKESPFSSIERFERGGIFDDGESILNAELKEFKKRFTKVFKRIIYLKLIGREK